VADFALHAPRSVDEACQALGRYEGEARLIAGGTALVLMIHQGLVDPPALVRLDTVPGLDRIEVDGPPGPPILGGADGPPSPPILGGAQAAFISRRLALPVNARGRSVTWITARATPAALRWCETWRRLTAARQRGC
jgi:hypothetical protein